MDNLTDRRDYFIDFAKGISILLVLWGHCRECPKVCVNLQTEVR